MKYFFVEQEEYSSQPFGKYEGKYGVSSETKF